MTSVLDAPGVLDADPSERETRRLAARATLGISKTGTSEPLRPVLREHGVSTYPMVALGLLAITDLFQSEAFTILTPDVSRALGLSLGAIAAARTLAFLAIVLAPLPMAALGQRRGTRAALCIVTGLAWSVVTLFTGLVTSLLGLIAVLVLDGVSTGSVYALHAPLLVDSYPPKARVRVLSGYSAMKTATTIGAPLLVSLLAGPFDLTWRGVFVGIGVVSLATSLFTLGLKDPGTGRFDTEALRAEEHEKVSGEHVTAEQMEAVDDVELKFFEIVRRVLLVPTVRRVASGYFALGVLVVPFGTFLSTFLEVKWDLGAAQRGVFFSVVAGISIVA
ncbi:MAG: MFS transporter, partial [Mycobacteriales bacterium]